MNPDNSTDNKIKFWGDRIKKRKVPSILHLTSGKLIRGNVHITEQYRFIDDINNLIHSSNFIVIADISNIHLDLQSLSIAYINLDQIVWMAPDSELKEESEFLRGELIEKRNINVTIKTVTAHEIVATAHVKKPLRAIDDFNLLKDERRFLSLTDARITNLKPPLPVIPYMTINRHHILWMIPED